MSHVTCEMMWRLVGADFVIFGDSEQARL